MVAPKKPISQNNLHSDLNTAPTVLRGLIVLEAVVKSQRPISATDLIELLGMPKATVNRILQQLEDEQLVQREPVNRRYLPGIRTRGFAFDVLANKGLGGPRHAILEALSEEIGETCNCAMLDRDRSIYFDRVETNWPYRIHLPIGSHLPLHCTASGKLFLAFMEARRRDALLQAAPLKRFTERTITDPEQLQAHFDEIRLSGVGVDDEEFMPGMVAIAVPVFNADNDVCFTVAVHAPKVRKSLIALRQYLPSLKRAAVSMAEIYIPPE